MCVCVYNVQFTDTLGYCEKWTMGRLGKRKVESVEIKFLSLNGWIYSQQTFKMNSEIRNQLNIYKSQLRNRKKAKTK